MEYVSDEIYSIIPRELYQGKKFFFICDDKTKNQIDSLEIYNLLTKNKLQNFEILSPNKSYKIKWLYEVIVPADGVVKRDPYIDPGHQDGYDPGCSCSLVNCITSTKITIISVQELFSVETIEKYSINIPDEYRNYFASVYDKFSLIKNIPLSQCNYHMYLRGLSTAFSSGSYDFIGLVFRYIIDKNKEEDLKYFLTNERLAKLICDNQNDLTEMFLKMLQKIKRGNEYFKVLVGACRVDLLDKYKSNFDEFYLGVPENLFDYFWYFEDKIEEDDIIKSIEWVIDHLGGSFGIIECAGTFAQNRQYKVLRYLIDKKIVPKTMLFQVNEAMVNAEDLCNQPDSVSDSESESLQKFGSDFLENISE